MSNELVATLTNELVAPLFLVLIGSALIVAKSYINKITESTIAKHDVEKVEKTLAAKNSIMKEIASVVEAAVGSNMETAESMKDNNPDKKLTSEQIEMLRCTAKTLATATLPSDLFNEESSLYEMFGGAENIEKIIDTYIDKYVYDYKLKKSSPESSKDTTEATTSEK